MPSNLVSLEYKKEILACFWQASSYQDFLVGLSMHTMVSVTFTVHTVCLYGSLVCVLVQIVSVVFFPTTSVSIMISNIL